MKIKRSWTPIHSWQRRNAKKFYTKRKAGSTPDGAEEPGDSAPSNKKPKKEKQAPKPKPKSSAR